MSAVMPSVIGARSLFPPVDQRLGIPGRGASTALLRKVCEANLAGSFPLASKLLKLLRGLVVSTKQVQLMTERVGQQLEHEREQATEAFLANQTPSPPDVRGPELLVVTTDGGRVQTRQPDPSEKWKEDKVGVVYDAAPTPEQPGQPYHGPRPHTRSVTATLDPWDRLGDHLSALAQRRGYEHAKQKVFVSDGASGIRAIRERCFPHAAFILDWAHAVEHLYECALARWGPGAQADDWFERQKEHLWHGRVSAVLGQVTRLAKALGDAPKSALPSDPRRILARNAEYFRTNRAGMDYPTFRRKGWPIGSGIIESTIKVVGKRMKGTEKHWTMQGAQHTLQVQTHLISDDGSWEAFWNSHTLAQRA